MSLLLVATTPADDLLLLSIEELRSAAGVADSSQDAELTKVGLRISSAIAEACRIRPAQGSAPTLKRETLQETFRECGDEELLLSRRHDIEILSVSIDGEAVAAAGYEVDPEAGILARLRDDRPSIWRGNKVVVSYKAGFSVVPDALQRAASEFVRHLWLEAKRDPSVKASEIEIEDIDRVRTEYWAGTVPGQGGNGVVPDFVAVQLSRYRNWFA